MQTVKQQNIDGKDLTGWFTEDFTLSELNQLKARERIPEFRPANTAYNDLYPVPTLEQVIELAEANYKKREKLLAYILRLNIRLTLKIIIWQWKILFLKH